MRVEITAYNWKAPANPRLATIKIRKYVYVGPKNTLSCMKKAVHLIITPTTDSQFVRDCLRNTDVLGLMKRCAVINPYEVLGRWNDIHLLYTLDILDFGENRSTEMGALTICTRYYYFFDRDRQSIRNFVIAKGGVAINSRGTRLKDTATRN